MSDTIVRPTFFEGEILPAADLIATVDSSRGQLARHERYLHRWGIAAGLKLQATSMGGSVSVVLTPGMAIDGSGREILVPANFTLNPVNIAPLPSGKLDTWYPVFLNGRDEQATGVSMLTGACTTSLPTQIKENYDVTCGSPGSELSLDEQTPPNPGDGPADGVTSNSWLILLGFVQFDFSKSTPAFTNAADSSPDSAVSRRYVGVNAATVVAGGGTLQLATHPTGSPDVQTIMALEIHESNNGEMIFGKQNADGSVMPALTVTSKGDVIAAGNVTGAVTPGSMQVQSGIASDGMVLPLPIGIDPAGVTAGKVTLFIHVTPRFDQLVGPTGGGHFLPFPYECHVDATTRQVHCRLQWWDTGALPPLPTVTPLIILPAPCDYTVIAAVAATGS
jgi:hypothetical protein